MSEGLAVCIPAAGPPTWALTRSLLALKGFGNGTYGLSLAHGMAVEQARNVLVERFLKTDLEWLLFVDADAIVHPDTAHRLASWGQPIVAALSFSRTQPSHPTIYAGADPHHVSGPQGYRIQLEETRDWIRAHPGLQTNDAALLDPAPEDSLRRVDFTGMHCTLIKREVFETVGFPWFERVHPLGGPAGAGEDYDFCMKAGALKIPIYVDRSVQAGHSLGEQSTGALTYMGWDRITDWELTRFDVCKE